MPEGPEVRMVADELRAILVGKDILSIEVAPRAKQAGLLSIEVPARIVSVESYGKKLLFYLGTTEGLRSATTIVTSLGMEGRWTFEKGKHSHISVEYGRYEDGMGYIEGKIYFDDSRYFGRVEALDDVQVKELLARLGPDPLKAHIEADEWKRIWSAPKIGRWRVSKALLEQSIIAGVGNYLRSEILYNAGLSGLRLVEDLSPEQLECLRIATHRIMEASYRRGGLTIKSFWSPSGKKGVYPVQVYGKDVTEEGMEVRVEKLDGRSVYWCPGKQK